MFDYGMVLTGEPDATAHDAMVRLTGLTPEKFEELYWADRTDYDAGRLTGLSFWEKFVRDNAIALTAAQLAEVNRLDVRMWTTESPAMVAWHRRLKQHGIKTAILSNMGDTVLASIQQAFAWLQDFDVLVWSFELGIVKPDPAIYRHTLEKLGTRAEETLFIDDRPVNTDAARALGMTAIEFTTVEKLREDLIAAGLDRFLPLPQ
jgi:putative hydrolase of the HAD superfamily